MIRLVVHMGLLGATLWVNSAGSVRAQPAPSVGIRQLAKQYTEAGIDAQKHKDYETAVAMYQKAYELIPHPLLIFDIAQAYRLAGRTDDAVREYKRYLSFEPSGPQSKMVRDLVAELEAQLSTDSSPSRRDRAITGTAEDVAATGSTMGDDAGAPRAVREVDRGDLAGTPPAPPRITGPTEIREASPGRKLRIIGLAVGGAGVVGLAIGAWAGARALHLSSVVHSMTDPRDDDGKRAETMSIGGFAAGGVLLATGAMLYWRGYSRDRAIVAATISDGGAGLAVIGFWP